MKTIVQIKILLVLVALSAIMQSFAPMGAHSFQILLDDKQLADQYATSKMTMPKIVIDPAENHKQLVVKYNECGRTVTGRVISVKDSNNKLVKEWRFEGEATGFKDAMAFNVKDIVALKNGSNNTLQLFYSSNDFREGQQIATLVIGPGTNTASR